VLKARVFKIFLKKMSVISEKVLHTNSYEVKIYREGAFWIAYEQSAYYFWQQKGYKPTKKFVKTLGLEVVSIGFPQNAYEILMNTILTPILEKNEPYTKVFILGDPIDTDAFKAWKLDLPLRSEPEKEEKKLMGIDPAPVEFSAGINELLQKLREFPLADKTPLECMIFLSELKKSYHSYGNL
jgi:hypothetical protein